MDISRLKRLIGEWEGRELEDVTNIHTFVSGLVQMKWWTSWIWNFSNNPTEELNVKIEQQTHQLWSNYDQF